MTIYQTRQLGIEFERRVQTILPQTETIAKLDTETIYSFLNQYQQKYAASLFNMIHEEEISDAQKSRIENILSPLRAIQTVQSMPATLAKDFACYDYSISTISSNYKGVINDPSANKVRNEFVNQIQFSKLVIGSFDALRILRQPVVTITQDNTLEIIHDRYTTISKVDIHYYRKPKYFDIMSSVPCEFPMVCFDDLVTGAVELYMTYVRGGIRQQEEDGRRERAAQRAAREEEERKRRNKNDEQ